MDWRRIRQGITGSLLLAALAAACGGDDADPTPTTTATAAATSPTPTVPQPTATPDPEAEVLAAYESYWEVYAEALRNRDDSRLDEVMTGPRLERGVRRRSQTCVRQGRCASSRVEPQSRRRRRDRRRPGPVFDEYENNSYYVDPETHQPCKPDALPAKRCATA